MATEDILKERQKTHGSFEDHAKASQALKNTLTLHCKNGALDDPIKRESLEMICHKIARTICGNPNYKDHWDDIAGYATLVSKELETE